MDRVGIHPQAAISAGVAASVMDRALDWLIPPARRLAQMAGEGYGMGLLRFVSLAVYEPATDLLWAFPCSGESGSRPEITDVAMGDVPSLAMLAGGHTPRVVADLAEYGTAGRDIRDANCRSSMTVPLQLGGAFLGFVTFGALVPDFFRPAVAEELAPFSEAFAILIERAFEAVQQV